MTAKPCHPLYGFQPPSTPAVGVGVVLRPMREGRWMNQRDLARAAGIRRDYVSRIESGDRVPSVETLARIVRALEASPEEAVSLLMACLPEGTDDAA